MYTPFLGDLFTNAVIFCKLSNGIYSVQVLKYFLNILILYLAIKKDLLLD